MFPMGISIIVSGLVGNSIGSGKINEGKSKGIVAAFAGVGTQVVFMGVLLILGDKIPRMYTEDEHTVQVIMGLWYLFVFQRCLSGA